MKEATHFFSDISSPDARVKNALGEAGFNVNETGEGTIELSSADIHTLQLAVHPDAIVIDYIESDSLQGAAGSEAVRVLKELAEEGGQILRASGVLSGAEGFWQSEGFKKEGGDYVYEA